MTSGRVSNANKIEVMNFFKKETDKQEEYNDKLRLLLIYILCGNDMAEIKQIIDTMKMIHQDKYDENFIEQILKKSNNYESFTNSTG